MAYLGWRGFTAQLESITPQESRTIAELNLHRLEPLQLTIVHRNGLVKHPCQCALATLTYRQALCFSFSILVLLIICLLAKIPGQEHWGLFLLQRCCLCKAVQRHANYRVQRMGIMMTALGSRSACTVRKGGSAWQLSAEWQTAAPRWAALCYHNQIDRQYGIHSLVPVLLVLWLFRTGELLRIEPWMLTRERECIWTSQEKGFY